MSTVGSLHQHRESAPAINIELYNTNREINGLVWEDAETKGLKYDQKVGNGTYDSDEKGISNIDVELIEKIVIDDIEYEYLWPADAFDGTVAEEGYNSTDVTEDGKYDLKMRAVNSEFARMTSACPVVQVSKSDPGGKTAPQLVVTSSNQSIGTLYILFNRDTFFLISWPSTNAPFASSLSGKWQ